LKLSKQINSWSDRAKQAIDQTATDKARAAGNENTQRELHDNDQTRLEEPQSTIPKTRRESTTLLATCQGGT
jgi:hypothetical protein